jgi:diguanylate cyclase (GGDEF)-like protein
MLLNRDELVSVLFRETDRAQRTNMPLALIAVGLVGRECRQADWGTNLHDQAEPRVVERITQLLRCYDSVGRMADGEYILVLPGCGARNAKTLAGRLRDEVFAKPIEADGQKARLNACYGVVASGGRSALVVLQEVENALRRARKEGPDSIECISTEAEFDPETFLLPVMQDESLYW